MHLHRDSRKRMVDGIGVLWFAVDPPLAKEAIRDAVRKF